MVFDEKNNRFLNSFTNHMQKINISLDMIDGRFAFTHPVKTRCKRDERSGFHALLWPSFDISTDF